MKPIHLPLRSALHQTLTTTSRTRPPNPLSPRFNRLPHPTTTRRPLSTNLTRLKPPSSTPPRRLYSTHPPPKQNPPYNPTPSLNSPPSLSLSQRLRKLSREYGWSAFGVYMLLSALDFPFCFAAVRVLGTDRIGRYEHVVVEWVKGVVPEGVREGWREWMGQMPVEIEGDGGEGGKIVLGGEEGKKKVEGYAVVTGGDDGEVPGVGVGVAGYDHGVKEAEQRNKSENASIWTQLALAYAIHKSFIFIRVPLTVAVTPKVVKVLRGWGWDIGKRRPKGVK